MALEESALHKVKHRFKQALTQEVAFNSFLIKQRAHNRTYFDEAHESHSRRLDQAGTVSPGGQVDVSAGLRLLGGDAPARRAEGESQSSAAGARSVRTMS